MPTRFEETLMIEVQLVYTIEGFEPEVYAVYTSETADECRDPHLRGMVKESLADGQDLEAGAWSTRVKQGG
jgi:hypothetical protein